MVNDLSKSSKPLKARFPLLYLYLYAKPKAFLFRNFYRTNEKRLLKGKGVSNSKKTSIILFTVHKAGSSFTQKILRSLAEDAGMIHIDFEKYFIGEVEKRERFFSNKDQLTSAFKSRGYCYGALRNFRNIPNFRDFKVILHLRDPRDVMTSQYYSVAYSHPVITRKYYNKRKIARRKTIDEHVLDTIERFKTTYTTYCNELSDNPNILLLKYEDMVNNFEEWLNKLTKFTGLDGNESLIKTIINESDFKVDDESIYFHKRSIKPGDHKNKLKASTIEKLNEEFEDVLVKLNYG